ncbi:MAG: family 78 glycoside hydrolase catalytic domain [Phycisphaerales bacterium JB063]
MKSLKSVLASCMSFACLVGCMGASMADASEGRDAVIAVDLRVESRVEPLAVDADRPVLSWRLSGGGYNLSQSAYRVRVASDPELLLEGRGDLWDSGQVASRETTGIPYQGEALEPGRQVFWQVKVWDHQGNASGWSTPASWGVGLGSDGWRGVAWIGLDALPADNDAPSPPPPHEEGFGQAMWIVDHDAVDGELPECERIYETHFSLPANAQIKEAVLWISADDEHLGVINGEVVSQSNDWREHQLEDVSAQVTGGRNTLRVLVRNTSPGYSGLIAHLIVTLEDGEVVRVKTDDRWQSTSQVRSGWEDTARLAGLGRCRELAAYGDRPWGDFADTIGLDLEPARYLRHTFNAPRPVRRAVLYSTTLGASDVYLNGQRVNDDYMAPGWTDYRQRVYYHTYDVTEHVRRGTNAWGAVLTDGWFSGYVGADERRDHYGKRPRVAMQLHLEYADGTREVVATHRGWRAMTGPLREASMLMGEHYDATRTMDGWSSPGFNERGWLPVDVGSSEVSPVIEAEVGPRVVEIERFATQAITEPEPGVYIFDLGQNFAGIAQLKIEGRPGQVITLRYGEMLNPDGTLYTANLRQARSIDTYVCRGDGAEVWSPRFTFHGFQYVEVSGLGAAPERDTITGIAIGSDTPLRGSFASSSELLNTLASNIYWTQRSNFLSVPTDCPQRDERLGWTGDAQIYIRTAALWCDVQPFFKKWLIDLADSQLRDGSLPWTAPIVRHVHGVGGPAWMDAGTVCPWALYEVYGDTESLAQQYEMMQRLIAYYEQNAGDDRLPPAEYHCFGDWLSMGETTPKDVIYMAYFAHSTRLTAKAARVLGRDADAVRYERLLEEVLAAFNEHFVDDAGVIRGNTQTCYAMAIMYDLLDDDTRHLAGGHLVKRIEAMDGHLSTGFVGTKDLMLALAKAGRNDVAYRLALADAYPSWGFSIRHGATSIWERWDGWTPERGFQTTIMNSFSHYAFGAVYQWMAENIGGIQLIDPGYTRFRIAPSMSDELTFADVSYDSIHGTIRSRWEIDDTGRLVMTVVVPPNTRAEIIVPADEGAEVTVNGDALPDVAIDGFIYEGRRLEVGAGEYVIVAEAPALAD